MLDGSEFAVLAPDPPRATGASPAGFLGHRHPMEAQDLLLDTTADRPRTGLNPVRLVNC